MHALARLRYEVMTVWCKWLGRRSHKAAMHWDRFLALLKRYPLSSLKIVDANDHPHLPATAGVAVLRRKDIAIA